MADEHSKRFVRDVRGEVKMQRRVVGMVEVGVDAADEATVDATNEAIAVDFGASDEPTLWCNGHRFSARSPSELEGLLSADLNQQHERLISIPGRVEVEGSRVVIFPDAVGGSPQGAYLSGSEARVAADKAHRIATSSRAAWPVADRVDENSIEALDGMVTERGDGAPLVVAMPRTGSTLLGTLFLLAREANGRSQFARYLHEPVAPVFWSDAGPGEVADFVAPSLTERDIVQESAYQFTSPQLARWFLTRGRRPIVFTMRHPQLAWPSRWRVMLNKTLAENPAHHDAPAMRHALAEDDFSHLGSHLTNAVRPADNGWYAFLAMLQMCVEAQIDFVIVDNTRFREDPRRSMQQLCARLGVDFTTDMVEWTTLDAAGPRIVMSDLARGEEYDWYYAATLNSTGGVRKETHEMVGADRFPDRLRGTGNGVLTLDEAVTWHQLLLSRAETLT